VENLALQISEKTIRYPDIPELLNELQIYTAEQLPSGNIRYGAPEGYHDDCVTSLALASWGLAKFIDTRAQPQALGKRAFTLGGKWQKRTQARVY